MSSHLLLLICAAAKEFKQEEEEQQQAFSSHVINDDDSDDDGLFLLEKIQFIPLVMRASLRPQKRDHISAFNTRTNRKVLHLRKCAEALLKELENKKSDENNEDSDEDKNNDLSLIHI